MSDLVLVTGVSGFIAKHVALALLKSGYSVRGTVRSLQRGDEVAQALAAAGADPSRFSVVAADLTSDNGWREAAEGCRYVQHVASPFPMKQPKEREALVPAAVGGTLRVLDAALQAGAERIVLTSSIVAMMYRANRPFDLRLGENDWSDTEWTGISAYALSKTRAEEEAWKRVRERGAVHRLSVVNPGFVLGPALDADIGTSLGVIKLFLDGAYPAAPRIHFPVVDVRDLAAIHVKAMELPAAGGRRLAAAGDTLSMPEMAGILRDALGEQARRVPRLALPDAMVRLLGIFDPAIRTIVPDLGVRPVVDSAYVTALTGVTFRPARNAVVDAGQSLIHLGLARP